MTSNFQLPAWLVHVVGIVMAIIVTLSADQAFMAMMPAQVGIVLHALVPLATYLGISQVAPNSPPPQAKP